MNKDTMTRKTSHKIVPTARGNFKALAHGWKSLGEFTSPENCEAAFARYERYGVDI